VFTFGRKSEQNEFAFPGIRTRRSFDSEGDANDIYGSSSYLFCDNSEYMRERYSNNGRIESACVLRRIELHNRELEDGQSPWSIRQTGVYHKLNAPTDSQDSPEQSGLTFILIAPSKKFEAQVSQSLDLSMSDDRAIGPWNIYRLLIADSLSGWQDYMAWLEEALKEQVSLKQA
jgi:hypothetical protein